MASPPRKPCRPAPVWRRGSAAVLLLGAIACADGATGPDGLECTVPLSAVQDGGALRDSLFALTDPHMAGIGSPALAFLGPSERVVGLIVEGRAVAVPHAILWWHEVVNLDVGGRELTVTYSPLTGSSLVFDRVGTGVEEFTVSRFLLHSNLMMRDEGTGSLWPQMSLGARCGPAVGTELAAVPFLETSWGTWLAMHRTATAVSAATGYARLYSLYPYGDYEAPDNREFRVPVGELDERRAPKERVLGVGHPPGGLAFPFGELAEAIVRFPGTADGSAVAEAETADGRLVVFWRQGSRTAAAFRPRSAGTDLTFEVREGAILDRETGSQWRVDGLAVDGPLAGARLPPFPGAHVAFWFAWSKFRPDTEIWTADG